MLQAHAVLGAADTPGDREAVLLCTNCCPEQRLLILAVLLRPSTALHRYTS